MDLAIECADGYRLRGTSFEPATPLGVTVIVSGAILTRERFYGRMARTFAGRGIRVITFANRGSGRSLAEETRPWTSRLADWGDQDLPAVIEHARGTSRDDRLYVLGHSMGGQVVALSESVHELDGVVTVASNEAWWGHWPKRYRLGALGAFVGISALGHALPTLPAGRLDLGPDVASTVTRDWARWGRARGRFGGPFDHHPRLREYGGRVLAFSFADDPILGCRRAIEALHGRYEGADVTFRHVAPAEIGVRRIGHFGFFRERAGPALWEQTIGWMDVRQSTP